MDNVIYEQSQAFGALSDWSDAKKSKIIGFTKRCGLTAYFYRPSILRQHRLCRSFRLFYVWMRRSLKSIFPDLFATLAAPKTEELIATPYRHGGKGEAEFSALSIFWLNNVYFFGQYGQMFGHFSPFRIPIWGAAPFLGAPILSASIYFSPTTHYSTQRASRFARCFWSILCTESFYSRTGTWWCGIDAQLWIWPRP